MADEQLTFRPAGKTDASGDITFHTGDWRVEGWDSGTPSYRDELITSADSDGATFSRVAKREAVEFTVRLRLVTQASMDVMLSKLRMLEEALATAERAYADGIDDPGVDAARLLWKPADASTTGILPLLRAEIVERPIAMGDDGIGWFLKTPVITISGLRDPFIYGDLTSVTVTGGTLSGTAAFQTVGIPAIGGTVPPWLKVNLYETAAVTRHLVQMGLEVPASAEVLYVGATGSPALGRTGMAGTLSGSRVTATSSDWVGMCTTPTLGHAGQYRMIAHLTKGAGSIRLRWGEVGGALTLNPQRTTSNDLFQDVDLGAVSVNGNWRGVIETSGTVALTGVFFVPMQAWFSAQTVLAGAGLGVLSVDGAVSGTGELNGSAMTLGGNWGSTAGKWTKATWPYGGPQMIQRTATSEGSVQFANAGATSYTAVRVGADMKVDSISEQGLNCRYTSLTQRLCAVMYSGSDTGLAVMLYDTTASQLWADDSFFTGLSIGLMARVELEVTTDGTWLLYAARPNYWNPWNPPAVSLVASGSHPSLATGGSLATGKVGLSDRHAGSFAATRSYRRFTVHGLESNPTPLLPAGKNLEITPTRTVRVNGARTDVSWRGGTLLVPPDRASRLLVLSRQFANGSTSEAAGLTSAQAVTVNARKRWLMIP